MQLSFDVHATYSTIFLKAKRRKRLHQQLCESKKSLKLNALARRKMQFSTSAFSISLRKNIVKSQERDEQQGGKVVQSCSFTLSRSEILCRPFRELIHQANHEFCGHENTKIFTNTTEKVNETKKFLSFGEAV
jgi:hypothetical protein